MDTGRTPPPLCRLCRNACRQQRHLRYQFFGCLPRHPQTADRRRHSGAFPRANKRNRFGVGRNCRRFRAAVGNVRRNRRSRIRRYRSRPLYRSATDSPPHRPAVAFPQRQRTASGLRLYRKPRHRHLRHLPPRLPLLLRPPQRRLPHRLRCALTAALFRYPPRRHRYRLPPPLNGSNGSILSNTIYIFILLQAVRHMIRTIRDLQRRW